MFKISEKKIAAIGFVTPNIILYILFFVIPFVLGFYYSLTSYNGISEPVFIGLDNYVKLFQDPEFWNALTNTFMFAIIKVPLVIFMSLSLALLLNSKVLKGKSLHRAVIYFPALLSTVMIGITWRWIFGQEYGIINLLLEQGGHAPIEWATNSTAAFITVIIATMWAVGSKMLMYLGGLSTISDTYYEASEIDGASTFQQFRYITWPMLKPTTYMVLTFAMVDAFKEYAMVNTLTGGGPGTDTTFIIQYIYQTGFERFDVGYASAASMVLFAILLTISIFREKINKGGKYD